MLLALKNNLPVLEWGWGASVANMGRTPENNLGMFVVLSRISTLNILSGQQDVTNGQRLYS